MNNQQQVEILAMCAEFFEQELAFNQTLYGIATLAFGLAILLATLHAIAALWKFIKMPAGGGAAVQSRGKGVPVSAELVKAITEFIAGLAKAPVWFFLFVAGLLLVWVSTVDVPEICEAPFADAAEQAEETDEDAAEPS